MIIIIIMYLSKVLRIILFMSLLVMLYLVTVLQDDMVRGLNFARLIVLKVLSIKDAILAGNKLSSECAIRTLFEAKINLLFTSQGGILMFDFVPR